MEPTQENLIKLSTQRRDSIIKEISEIKSKIPLLELELFNIDQFLSKCSQSGFYNEKPRYDGISKIILGFLKGEKNKIGVAEMTKKIIDSGIYIVADKNKKHLTSTVSGILSDKSRAGIIKKEKVSDRKALYWK